MRYIQFEIKNFKGIKHLVLDLKTYPQSEIFSLVGLNESGKTTILEAIRLLGQPIEPDKAHTMIHKSEVGGFDGDIEIIGILKLEKADKKFIRDFLRKYDITIQKNIDQIKMTRKYYFEKSQYQDDDRSGLFFEKLGLRVKGTNDTTYKSFDDEESYRDIKSDMITNLIDKNYIPKILYFDNFLVDFPEKIYLDTNDSRILSDKNQRAYRYAIEDVLNRINSEYNRRYTISDICSKIKSNTPATRESLKKIKLDMSRILNGIILGVWQERGLSSNVRNKTFQVDLSSDDYGCFLSIMIIEENDPFGISDRSAGFRWFFGFYLFTEFRKSRKHEKGVYLFLFDEPASNLHPKAQIQFLKAFEGLIKTDNAMLIYSTHSHYLLDRRFVFVSSFVCRDRGIHGDRLTDSSNQDITAELYVKMDKKSSQQGDFQIILDTLEYIDNPFIETGNVVFLEGKSDYWTFQWIKKIFLEQKKYNFGFYPGTGVDHHDKIFREYLAHQRTFIAIFDGDDAGQGSKKRYTRNVSCELKNNTFTFKDINYNFHDFKIEDLFVNEDKLRIRQEMFPDSKIEEVDNEQDKDIKERRIKSQIDRGILKLFCNEQKIELSQETLKNFEMVFDFIDEKFKELEKQKNAPD